MPSGGVNSGRKAAMRFSPAEKRYVARITKAMPSQTSPGPTWPRATVPRMQPRDEATR